MALSENNLNGEPFTVLSWAKNRRAAIGIFRFWHLAVHLVLSRSFFVCHLFFSYIF